MKKFAVLIMALVLVSCCMFGKTAYSESNRVVNPHNELGVRNNYAVKFLIL